MSQPQADFWKRKLAAYLHDPPSKCLDIRSHGERSEAAFRQAGFTDTEVGEYFRHADHTGASADRLPFPHSQAAGLRCAFDGVRSAFLHPLSGTPFRFHAPFASAAEGFEGEQSVQPVPSADSLERLPDDAARWRARFFAHWRLWPKFAVEKDYRLALLPADTRIPDHNIWTHMQVVSALAGCLDPDKRWRPAFLKLQLGPVQDFIAAARSIRDLWSGSYLLSWLMAAGLKALSEKVGPDAVIFPNLREQPIFDLHWRSELWSQVAIGNRGPVWESLGWKSADLLTPGLPNVFLAVVPASRAAALGQAVVAAIQDEWEAIAGAVWKLCNDAGLAAGEGDFTADKRKARFDAQVRRFLSLSWQATPWPETLEQALSLADGLAPGTPLHAARARVQAVVAMAQEQMPVEHRDKRFYTDDTRTKLNNIGLGWSVILAHNGWELDAVRQTRAFDATRDGGWAVGTFNNKDALTGREEAVAGGDRWHSTCRQLGAFWPKRFKKEHWLGAPTLIKRLWDVAYLEQQWSLSVQKSPNTRGVAAHDPFADDARWNDEDESRDTDEHTAPEKYFAVLALDGDEIGKWISGEKTPPFRTQLACTDGAGNPAGALEYFNRASNPDNGGVLRDRFAAFLDSRRPLSPSYHLQFSEALGNFAMYCARPIVDVFDGRLIYAGGDDVLALLPADTALACARALRMAFRGEAGLKAFLETSASMLRERHDAERRRDPAAAMVPHFQKRAADGQLLEAREPGFLRRLDQVDQDHREPIPLLVPGPEADCSVGIAMAHFKAPLQDVVRAAQQAEKRAKRSEDAGGQGRSAVAVTLMKRSGEIIEWGAKWEGGGLQAHAALLAALRSQVVSSKFPHRVIELVEAYKTTTTGLSGKTEPAPDFEKVVDAILEHDIGTAAQRQRGRNYSPDKVASIQSALRSYMQSLPDSTTKVDALIGLCQTVAFASRTDATSESEPQGNA